MRREEEESRITVDRVIVDTRELAVPAVRVVADELEVRFGANRWRTGFGVEHSEPLSAVEADAGTYYVLSD